MPNDSKPDKLHARSRDEWRDWLERHGTSKSRVLLEIYRKESGVPSVRYDEAVLDALCFGWVDSRALPKDDRSFYLTFAPRRPSSTWGKANRERAERLIAEGLMRPTGQAVIDAAKKSGVWDVLAQAQDGTIPEDLQVAFDEDSVAYANFEKFPSSSQRRILEWISAAKQPETRARRVRQTVELAHRNERAGHPRS